MEFIRNLSIIFLILFSFHSFNFAQEQRNSATEKLAVLSENMTADDIEEVRSLIEAGGDVNVKNKYGVSPLFMAAHNGNAEIVKLLLNSKADVNTTRESDGITALLVASFIGNVDIVKILLTEKADVNVTRQTDDVSAIWIAAQEGHSEIVKLLISAKANVNATDTYGMTPLYIASQNGYVEVVKSLIAASANVNTPETRGMTPLFIASRKGFVEVVKLLLSAKANVNAAPPDGTTPLYEASQEGKLEIVKLLLGAKADVDAATTNGTTPLYMASQNGHTEIVKLLLGARADVNAAEKTTGRTPLMMGSFKGHTEIVKLLLEAKANVNAAEKTSGLNAVMVAFINDHLDIAKLLNSQPTLKKPSLQQIVYEEKAIVREILSNGVGDRLVIPGVFTSNASPSAATLSSPGEGSAFWSTMELPSDGIPIINSQPDIFGYKSIHRFDGEFKFEKNNLPTFIGKGSIENRLTFVLVKDIGYVYVRGFGEVIFPDGRKVKLGSMLLDENTDVNTQDK